MVSDNIWSLLIGVIFIIFICVTAYSLGYHSGRESLGTIQDLCLSCNRIYSKDITYGIVSYNDYKMLENKCTYINETKIINNSSIKENGKKN